MNKNSSNIARWTLALFSGFLIIINAALTFAFGYTYLGPAFGSGEIASYSGAFYALLLFDIGYLSWFWTYLRTAKSTSQRDLAFAMTVFSLLGSLSATLQQLATNATQLVDLTAYHQSVGMIALGAMLLMTTAHIIATAAYVVLSPEERQRQAKAKSYGKALERAIDKAENMITHDEDAMVDAMARDMRLQILGSMNFTEDVKMITVSQRPTATDDYQENPSRQLPTEEPLEVTFIEETQPDTAESDANFTQRQ